MCHYIQKHCLEQKWKYSRINFLCGKKYYKFHLLVNFFLKSGSSGALIDRLENVSKFVLTSQFLTENNLLWWSS